MALLIMNGTPNYYLSICIPTYNRSARLSEGLRNLLPEVSKNNIAIYISDNASTDDTENVVNNFKMQYGHIYYHKNEVNLGYDRNFEHALKMSKSKYAWLLSDDDRIVPTGIDRVLNALTGYEIDLLVLNGGLETYSSELPDSGIEGRVPGIVDCVYSNHSLLMADLGWQMTWISCLVFSRKMIDDGNFALYRGTCLTHVGTMFNYLSCPDIKVKWISTPLVYGVDGRKPAWMKSALQIFVKNWYEIIISQSDIYSINAKYKCILDHGCKSGLFSRASSFVYLRINEAFNFKQFIKYIAYYKYITTVPIYILLAISLSPVCLLIMVKKILKYIIAGERV